MGRHLTTHATLHNTASIHFMMHKIQLHHFVTNTVLPVVHPLILELPLAQ